MNKTKYSYDQLDYDLLSLDEVIESYDVENDPILNQFWPQIAHEKDDLRLFESGIEEIEGDGQTEGMLLIHGRNIVKAVEIRGRLNVCLIFDQLFSATMQQSNMRICALHYFTIKLQYKAQNAMRRWMLWSKV